jgi:hypothetical protein
MITWTEESFIPPTTTADPGALAEQAQTLMNYSGRIIGRGTEMADQMNATAVDFSELVAEPLKQNAAFSLDASKKAMEGAIWASSVTRQWAADVSTFLNTTNTLKREWDTAARNLFGVVRSSFPTVEEFHAAVNAAGAKMYGEVNPAAIAAHETFLSQAAAAGQQLAGGPDPANLQALAAGAAGGSWAMFNIFGAAAAPRVLTGADGTVLAGLLADGLREDTITPQVRDSLQSLMALLGTANTGKTLSADQMAFVGNFLKGLDQPLPGLLSDQESMLFALPDHLQFSPLSQADQQLIMGAAGAGIIALSNPAYAKGALTPLPPTVQALADRYFGLHTDSSPLPPETKTQLLELGALFGAANAEGLKDLEAGLPLSAALTMGVVDTNPGGYAVPPAELMNVLDVSTRNHEASAALISGDLTHPAYGDATPEHVLRGVFGPQWSDEGAVASRLVNWIPKYSLSSDPAEQRLGSQTAFDLFTTMTNDEPGLYWNESAHQFFTDGYGGIDGDAAASLGKANPEIARALGDITFSHLPNFGQETPGTGNSFAWNDDPEQREFSLDARTRASVFELVMADGVAADTLGSRVYSLAMADASSLHRWETLGTTALLGNENGRLLGLLDGAYGNLQADTGAGVEGAGTAGTASDARHSAWARGGASILKEIGGELFNKVPGLKTLSTAGTIFIKNILEAPKWVIPVGQAEGVWLSYASAGDGNPVKLDLPRYEEVNFELAHRAVEGMLLDDANSTLTIDEVQQAARRYDLDPGLVVAGDRLVDPRTTLKGLDYDAVGAVYIDLLEAHGQHEKFANLRDILTGQRLDVGNAVGPK